MSDTHLTDVPFAAFDIPAVLMQGIEEAGFSKCTPIQAETLPIALEGRDVAGQAQTGTGKTAAFLIAVYNHLLIHPANGRRKPSQPRALILAPTRELAIQIHADAMVLGRYTDLKVGLAYGGTGYDTQRETIAAGVDMLIGTPGRLIDYYRQRVYDLKKIAAVVLDEADRMFDLGFIKDIRYLLRRCPPPEARLSMLFSATLSHRVNELAYEHMNRAVQVDIEPERVTAERVRQVLYHVSNEEKLPLLRAFQAGELPVLIATDVASRGLHIPDVSHVFNYDLPQDAEDYVHRIGRTARIGKDGDAVSFACEEFVYSLPDIEEYIGHKIPVEAVPDDYLQKLSPPVKIKREGGQGHRGKVRHKAGKKGPRKKRERRARHRSPATG
jgi:ATP-dependent RNA helicase RhlB